MNHFTVLTLLIEALGWFTRPAELSIYNLTLVCFIKADSQQLNSAEVSFNKTCAFWPN